jgi:hypothetical protein
MAKTNPESAAPVVKKRLVLCPGPSVDDATKRCGTEVDLEQMDECPVCGLDVEKVYQQRRYRRALANLEEDEKAETTPKKKKRDFGSDLF